MQKTDVTVTTRTQRARFTWKEVEAILKREAGLESNATTVFWYGNCTHSAQPEERAVDLTLTTETGELLNEPLKA